MVKGVVMAYKFLVDYVLFDVETTGSLFKLLNDNQSSPSFIWSSFVANFMLSKRTGLATCHFVHWPFFVLFIQVIQCGEMLVGELLQV